MDCTTLPPDVADASVRLRMDIARTIGDSEEIVRTLRQPIRDEQSPKALVPLHTINREQLKAIIAIQSPIARWSALLPFAHAYQLDRDGRAEDEWKGYGLTAQGMVKDGGDHYALVDDRLHGSICRTVLVAADGEISATPCIDQTFADTINAALVANAPSRCECFRVVTKHYIVHTRLTELAPAHITKAGEKAVPMFGGSYEQDFAEAQAREPQGDADDYAYGHDVHGVGARG